VRLGPPFSLRNGAGPFPVCEALRRAGPPFGKNIFRSRHITWDEGSRPSRHLADPLAALMMGPRPHFHAPFAR
jgi:hypothetical protein